MKYSVLSLALGLVLASPQDRLERLRAEAQRASDASARLEVLREAGRAWNAGDLTSAQLAAFSSFLGGLQPAPPAEPLAAAIERGILLPCADLLAARMADPDPAARRRCAEALGRIGGPTHAAVLEPLLEDEDAETAAAAAVALLHLRASDRAVESIVALVSSGRLEGATTSRVLDAASGLEGGPVVEAVRMQAGSSDFAVRAAALRCLSRMGRRLPLERILPLLKDSDPGVRKSVVDALARRGATSAAESIVPLLKDGDLAVRAASLDALGSLKAVSSAAAVAELLAASQPKEIRRKAAASLGEMGARDRADDLLAQLQEPDVEIRLSCAQALMTMDARDRMKELFDISLGPRGWFGEAMVHAVAAYRPVESMPLLVQRLAEERNRRTVLWVLGLCRGGWRFSEPLLRILKEGSRGARVSALDALGRLCVRGAAPDVAPFLKDEDRHVRELAVEALGRMGDRGVIPDLVPLLRDPHPRLRQLALNALERLGAEDRGDEILELLEDGNAWVRADACRALGHLGVSNASGPLTRRLGDTVWWVRIRALEALALLDDPSTEKAVASMLEDSHPHVRDSAVEALGRLGAESRLDALLGPDGPKEASIRRRAVEGLAWIEAPGIFNRLLPLIEDGDSQVRGAVSVALVDLGAPAAIGRISDVLRSHVVGARASAVEMLGRISTRESVAILAGLMTDPDETVATGAIRAVGRSGEARHLPKVLVLLRSPVGSIRAAAAGAIGLLGARESLADLEPCFHDDDEQVLAEAMKSWVRLGGSLDKLRDPLPRLTEPGRVGLAEAVALSGDPAAAARIAGLLKDPRSRVREAAVSAILRLRAVDHREALIASLDDPDATVRIRAALAVARLSAGSDEAVLRELRALREDPIDDVRLAAEISLIRLGDRPADDPGRARRVWRQVLRRPTAPWSEFGPELFDAVMQSRRPAGYAKAARAAAASAGPAADVLKQAGFELKYAAAEWPGPTPAGLPDPNRRVVGRAGRTAMEALEEAAGSRPGILVEDGALWPLWNRSAMRALDVLLKTR